MAAGKSARKVIMKERNTTLETTDHNNRNNSENIKETPDERIPGKLIGAIVAISAVELLKAFLVSTTLTSEQIGWKIAIHLTFVISGLLFAASDWISDSRKSA